MYFIPTQQQIATLHESILVFHFNTKIVEKNPNPPPRWFLIPMTHNYPFDNRCHPPTTIQHLVPIFWLFDETILCTEILSMVIAQSSWTTKI